MSSIELNLNWNSLAKKRTKENKKMDKIEQKIGSSLEFYHSKMESKFKNAREKIIPKKIKFLEKAKKDCDKSRIQTEIDGLLEEENEYNLNVMQKIIEYENYKQQLSLDGSNHDRIIEKLDDTTHDYFRALGVEYIPKLSRDDSVEKCNSCGKKLQELDVSSAVCVSCGVITQILTNVCVSYKELQDHDMSYDFSYKRMTHFQEWLNNFQAKENTTIPDEIINKILIQLKQERITDLSNVTNSDIRGYLKKLNYNKYYEHISTILNRINDIPPLRISDDVEIELKKMFNKIQEPFDKHKPDGRKNFLSYAYVLRKFFELLDRREFLVYFPLLKARDKVFLHDRVWKDICTDLNWNYIPSV